MLCVCRVSAVQYNENTSETKLYVNDKEIYLSSIERNILRLNSFGTSWQLLLLTIRMGYTLGAGVTTAPKIFQRSTPFFSRHFASRLGGRGGISPAAEAAAENAYNKILKSMDWMDGTDGMENPKLSMTDSLTHSSISDFPHFLE